MDDLSPLIGEARASLALTGKGQAPDREQAAREFEGYLLRVLLGEMRRTVRSGGLFDGRATQGYLDLLDDALTRQLAERGGLGLAGQLLAQWQARP
jgi:Rod binding domain-containing protein